MKKLILKSIASLLLIAVAVAVTLLPERDIGREVAENVVAFTINSRGNAVYATGFHIKYEGKMFIMTNKHVCKAGIRLNNNKTHIQVNNRIAKIIKIWESHDLCALESWKDDGLRLADEAPSALDKIILVGHPRGLPTIIRKGRIVGAQDVCFRDSGCHNSTMISATAYPGNSGSPVTDEDGDVVGVLFAGSPRYPHETMIVPYRRLKAFLEYLVAPKEVQAAHDELVSDKKEDEELKTIIDQIISDILEKVKQKRLI